ncbi:uncharacterized protein LOC128218763 [Mya arenaria]|uniref:uncharacterized protein LOC128218763 n=1 Tax=Mya arenaria TaxID=6604 RepID=UPI0022DFA978|nr:uncharacterized protein LOC128218763 [Mya arenaria]
MRSVVGILFMFVATAMSVNVQLLQPYAVTAETMYHNIDVNHDSIFTLQEFIDDFRQYDIDHDGKITRHEYTSFVCFLTPTMYQLSHYLFDEFDSDSNHHLDTGDFGNFYHLLDSDHNGTVSLPEWTAWWVKTFQSLEGADHHVHGHSNTHGNSMCT